MPTSFLTVNQIFRGTTQGAVPAATSGLALNDPVRRPGAFNAEIHGNMIIDPAAPGTRTYYAGLISIAPDALQTSDGFIRNINYATGELCIGGDPTPAAACPATDTRVRLNDPNAKYGIAQVSPDKRFAVDEGNATVTSNTGYPMCIPRVAPPAVDTLCPIGNRPINLGNQYLSTFVMNGTANYTAGAVPKAQPAVTSCWNVPALGTITSLAQATALNRCVPTLQAPLVVGDYITFQGILTSNVPGVYVSAYSLIANVGIFTEKYANNPTGPAYMRIESARVGTGPTGNTPGCPNNAECVEKIRVVGFTTDPTRVSACTVVPCSPVGTQVNQLHIYHVDVNNLTGARTSRGIQGTTPFNDQGNFGRFRVDIDKDPAIFAAGTNNQSGIAREVMVSLDFPAGNPLTSTSIVDGVPVPPTATVGRAGAGFVTRQYYAPWPEYIFPEPSLSGVPFPESNFQCLNFLANGWGVDVNGANVVVPAPSPWPKSTGILLLPSDCTTP